MHPLQTALYPQIPWCSSPWWSCSDLKPPLQYIYTDRALSVVFKLKLECSTVLRPSLTHASMLRKTLIYELQYLS